MAICEAVTRPNMRFAPVKSADQQAVLMLHRTRALLIRRQTMLTNAFRAHLAEFGIMVAQGIRHVRELIETVSARKPSIFPPRRARRFGPRRSADGTQITDQDAIEKEVLAWHRTSQESRRLAGHIYGRPHSVGFAQGLFGSSVACRHLSGPTSTLMVSAKRRPNI